MNKRFLPLTILSAFLLVASATTAQTTESGKKAFNQNNATQETINDVVESTTSSTERNIPTKAVVAETPKEVKLDPTIQREHVVLNTETSKIINSTPTSNSPTILLEERKSLAENRNTDFTNSSLTYKIVEFGTNKIYQLFADGILIYHSAVQTGLTPARVFKTEADAAQDAQASVAELKAHKTIAQLTVALSISK